MQLMRESDVVSVHCPLTEETLGMIGAEELAAMKPTAVLVNSARGEVVDEEALIDVLRAGKIRGAGIDVFNEEPPSTDSGLMSLDNVSLSPHNAGSTEGCSIQAAVMAAEIVDDVLSGRRPQCLNPRFGISPVCARESVRAAPKRSDRDRLSGSAGL